MNKNDLTFPINKLKEAIKNLEDDREKLLEIYESLAEWLFGVTGTMKEPGKRGLLDPDVIANLVNIMQNMTQSSKTKAEISKILFEEELVYNDVMEGQEEDKESSGGKVIDRKSALKLVNMEEE